MRPYKAKFDILPYLSKGLSPRHLITSTAFKNICTRVKLDYNNICVLCGCTDKPLHIHESFTLDEKAYAFDGFFPVCAQCHEIIHMYKVSAHIGHILDNRKKIFVPDVMISKFKNEKQCEKDLREKIENAVFFSLNTEPITADYSKVELYGLSQSELEAKNKEMWSPKLCCLMFLFDNPGWSGFFSGKKMSKRYNYLNGRYIEDGRIMAHIYMTQYEFEKDFFIQTIEKLGQCPETIQGSRNYTNYGCIEAHIHCNKVPKIYRGYDIDLYMKEGKESAQAKKDSTPKIEFTSAPVKLKPEKITKLKNKMKERYAFNLRHKIITEEQYNDGLKRVDELWLSTHEPRNT